MLDSIVIDRGVIELTVITNVSDPFKLGQLLKIMQRLRIVRTVID